MKFKYNEDDFVEKKYKKILKKIKNKTIFYDQIKSKDNFTLWRHDVDFSIHRAYSLAKIEKNLNIKSTYFILLSCNFYNIFEKEIKDLIEKIIFLGHNLGLHFDVSQYDIQSEKQLEKYLNFEKKILENLFKIKIKVFSFHNTTASVLKYDNFKYARMINTYSKYFKEKVRYCSDSNGYWRYNKLDNFLSEKYNKIQILTHPAWWQKSIMSPFKRINRCVNGRSKNVILNYKKNLKKNGRKNIK